jgi:hypothetical protein|mmetsp:Transcript_15515/g.2586  ORF Transcript_15515/g.2586 Transcript_15515/m.2586 type:complete len:88 (+) Transcript_15515:434-697(+)
MVIGDDIGPENLFPIWDAYDITYTNSTDGSELIVRSPFLATPDDYPIGLFAGFHFCKILSPARAIEWMYIDSLRWKGALASTEEIDI